MIYFYSFLKSLGLLSLMLITVYVMIYLDRKLIGHLQARHGPMTGFHGIVQPLADWLKMTFKGRSVSQNSRGALVIFAPAFALIPATIVYTIIPVSRKLLLYRLDVGLILIFTLLFLSILGISVAGLSSGNRQSAFGSLYVVANALGFILPMIISTISVMFLSGSMDVIDVINAQNRAWFVLTQPIGALIFLVSTIQLVGRSQLEIPSIDLQNIAGFDAEFSGINLNFLRLTEYINVLTLIGLTTMIYLGGWLGPINLHSIGWYIVKTYAVLFLVLWIKNSIPWPRFEASMSRISWGFLFPLSVFNLIITIVFVVFIKPLIRV